MRRKRIKESMRGDGRKEREKDKIGKEEGERRREEKAEVQTIYVRLEQDTVNHSNLCSVVRAQAASSQSQLGPLLENTINNFIIALLPANERKLETPWQIQHLASLFFLNSQSIPQQHLFWVQCTE